MEYELEGSLGVGRRERPEGGWSVAEVKMGPRMRRRVKRSWPPARAGGVVACCPAPAGL